MMPDGKSTVASIYMHRGSDYLVLFPCLGWLIRGREGAQGGHGRHDRPLKRPVKCVRQQRWTNTSLVISWVTRHRE